MKLKPFAVRCAAAAALAFTAAGAGAQSVTGYALTDLGTLGGGSSWAYDVNNQGWVTGTSSLLGDTAQHAFIYSNGSMKDIGTLGGSNSVGRSINDNGWVAGSASLAGDSATHAFRWEGSNMRDLGALPGQTNSDGYGINNAGTVVGAAQAGPTPGGAAITHAFTYSSPATGLTEIPMPALPPTGLTDPVGYVNSIATSINNHGQVGGTSFMNQGTPQIAPSPFRYTPGSTADLLPVPTSRGYVIDMSVARIADDGTMVGTEVGGSRDFSPSAAVKFVGRTWGGFYSNNLAPPGSNSGADDINALGQVVGWSDVTEGKQVVGHATVTFGTTNYDLNTLVASGGAGWDLYEATGINDKGQIVGLAFFNGHTRAFLATPVPEPQTWALFLGGIGLLWARRARAAGSRSGRLHGPA